MPKHKTFTDTIRAAVLSAPISRYQLAKRVNVSQATLSGFVNGFHGIGSDLLDRIAPILGLRLAVGRPRKARK